MSREKHTPSGSSKADTQPPSPAPQEPDKPKQAAPAAAPPETLRTSVGKLIRENTQFLSSVVIGGAGLIATSLHQCSTADLARRQSQWQRRMEVERSNNAWRIERAKILADNLRTLTQRGGDTAEQRYGVLLSLTRGKIIERDLAVSYALELGKDSPEDMRSVLLNIEDKDIPYYKRLIDAYVPTCMQRFGITVPSMYVCRKDEQSGLADGLADSVADDLTAATFPNLSPALQILHDERYIQVKLVPLVGLYGAFISEMYERRQWPALELFAMGSPGARLIGTLNLLMQPLDQINSEELAIARQRFEAGRLWLQSYVSGPSCDGECRGRVLSVLVSNLTRSPDYFPSLLRSLLSGQRAEVESAINRLQGRISSCQMEPTQTVTLRDQVLVPALLAQATKPQIDAEFLDGMLGLLQLLPLPPSTSPDWKKLQEALSRATKGRQPKQFLQRYAQDQQRRKPAAPLQTTITSAGSYIRGTNFCNVVSQYQEPPEEQEE